MEKLNLFQKLSLNKFYKYILYLGGIILILSLFMPSYGIKNLQIQKYAFGAIILGILFWINENIFETIDYYTNYSEDRKIFWFIYYIIILILILISGWIFFNFLI